MTLVPSTSLLPSDSDAAIEDIGSNVLRTGTGVMSDETTFRIWNVRNRNYGSRCFLTTTGDEAREMAVRAGHIRQPWNTKRVSDDTDEWLLSEDPIVAERTRLLLETDAKGMVQYDDEEGWILTPL